MSKQPQHSLHRLLIQAGDPKRKVREGDGDTEVLTRPKVHRPSQYQVYLLNDDYTPMDFVVFILMRFFDKNADDAVSLMLRVHHQGRALCGVYPHEIAETKVAQVHRLAREEQHPLRCLMEKKP